MSYETDQDMYNGKVVYGFVTVRGNYDLPDNPAVYFKCAKTTAKYRSRSGYPHTYNHSINGDLGLDSETGYFRGSVDAVVGYERKPNTIAKTYRLKLTHDFGLKAPKNTSVRVEDNITITEATGDAWTVSKIYLDFGDGVKTNIMAEPIGTLTTWGTPYGKEDTPLNWEFNFWTFFVDREKCSSGYIES